MAPRSPRQRRETPKKKKNLLFLPSVTAAPRRGGAELAPGRPAAGTAVVGVHSTARKSLFPKCKFTQRVAAALAPGRRHLSRKAKRFPRSSLLLFGGICRGTCGFCVGPGQHLPADDAPLPPCPPGCRPPGLSARPKLQRLREALSHRRDRKGVSAVRSEERLDATERVPGQRPSAEVWNRF